MKKYQPPTPAPLSADELRREREGFMARRRDRFDELKRIRIPERERTKGGFPRGNRKQRGERG